MKKIVAIFITVNLIMFNLVLSSCNNPQPDNAETINTQTPSSNDEAIAQEPAQEPNIEDLGETGDVGLDEFNKILGANYCETDKLLYIDLFSVRDFTVIDSPYVLAVLINPLGTFEAKICQTEGGTIQDWSWLYADILSIDPNLLKDVNGNYPYLVSDKFLELANAMSSISSSAALKNTDDPDWVAYHQDIAKAMIEARLTTENPDSEAYALNQAQVQNILASIDIPATANSEQIYVEIRNASMVDGAAAKTNEVLAANGIAAHVSTTQWPQLARTWIFYKDASYKSYAYQIGNALDVDSGDYFCMASNPDAWKFDKDVIVLTGLSWVNANMLEEGQSPYVLGINL
jgi:hypothetical protein